MADRLTHTHIIAQAKLRSIISGAAGALWAQLGSYNKENVDPFLATLLPMVLGAQHQSAALTSAYLSQTLGRTIVIDPNKVSGAAVRAGIDPAVVYTRPFIQVWKDLGNDVAWQDAVNVGQSRVESSAEMDMSLTSRATFDTAQSQDDGIYGYQRVADGGACTFCQAIDGAYVKSANASPLHNRCGCGLEPLTSAHPNARYLPDGSEITSDYAIHQHGELGQVLASPDDHFTTEAQALG